MLGAELLPLYLTGKISIKAFAATLASRKISIPIMLLSYHFRHSIKMNR